MKYDGSRQAAFDREVRRETLRTLREYRMQQKLTQTVVAQRMGIGQPSVAQLEWSDNPKLETLQHYAWAIGCKIEVEIYRFSYRTVRVYED